CTTRRARQVMAAVAFSRIAVYDGAINDYFTERTWPSEQDQPFPTTFSPIFFSRQTLRYGENPHQRAAFYKDFVQDQHCVATAEQLHGKELSYNNILDLDSALNLVREFAGPACVVVKHNNPCGAATAATLADAFRAAWDGDPLSAFGGILA